MEHWFNILEFYIGNTHWLFSYIIYSAVQFQAVIPMFCACESDFKVFFGRAGPQPPFPDSKFHLRSRHPDTLLWNIMETGQTRFVNCSKTRQNGAQLLILVHIYTHRVHDGFICLIHFSLNAFTTIPFTCLIIIKMPLSWSKQPFVQRKQRRGCVRTW